VGTGHQDEGAGTLNRQIAVIGKASYVGLLGALIGIIGVGAVVNEVPLVLFVAFLAGIEPEFR
jgi:hypothetical protein